MVVKGYDTQGKAKEKEMHIVEVKLTAPLACRAIYVKRQSA